MIPSGFAGISGMVKVAANHFLVIHDTKGPLGARLGVIDIKTDGPKYTQVSIPNWPSSEPLPNDLEGICAIPNRPGEYLAVESGFYPKYGKFGRVIKLGYREGTPLIAQYLGAFRPFPSPQNEADTPKHEQIEGIASVASNGVTGLLFALRGDTETHGQLIWGKLTDLDKPTPKFEEIGRHSLSPQANADRRAADLFTREDSTNAWEVLSVATVDPGTELGPFRSSVYVAGTLSISGGTIGFIPDSNCGVLWDFEGLKVEALAAPAELIPKSGLSIATDDEIYEGIWRPILLSSGPQAPCKMLVFDNVTAACSLK